MIKLSTNSVTDGLMPAEKIAIIEVESGEIEEVSVSEGDISPDNKLIASEIGRQGERVLIELPRESASGRWRVWVKSASVGI
jgi:hypothetical protein